MTRLMVLSVLAFTSLGAWAIEVTDLYSTEVPVATQQAQERESAIRRALVEVLVKVTGSQYVEQTPGIDDPLTQADRYVEQYRYRTIKEVQPVDPNSSMGDGATPQIIKRRVLWVKFDPSAVNRLAADVKLPLWDSTRPLVLAWIAVQDRSRRYLVDPESQSKLVNVIRNAAHSRGLPMVFPLMDLEDQANIDSSEVWGDFTDTILSASKRYRADAILVGRVRKVGSRDWQSRWTLYQNDGTDSHWETFGDTLDSSLIAGVDVNADTLVSQFAQVWTGDGQERLFMAVDGVDSFDRYAKALRYLTSLDQVSDVEISQVVQNRVEYQLTIRGTRDGLRKVMALGDVFSEVESPPVDSLFDANILGGDDEVMSVPVRRAIKLSYRMLP